MIILLFLIYLSQSASSHEHYGDCINLLKSRIPIDRKDEQAKRNLEKLAELFDKKPSYKDKEKICKENKNAFDRVGMFILRDLNLEHKITKDQMTRCISRNIHLFSYAILTMNDQFPEDFARIKNKYIDSNQDIFSDFQPEYDNYYDYLYEM